MVHWSENQYLDYMAKKKGLVTPEKEEVADPGPETDLQGKIQKYCKENGLLCQ